MSEQNVEAFKRGFRREPTAGRRGASGVPVHIVAARLGHTPTTLSTYAHLLPQSDEVAAERVAAALAA